MSAVQRYNDVEALLSTVCHYVNRGLARHQLQCALNVGQAGMTSAAITFKLRENRWFAACFLWFCRVSSASIKIEEALSLWLKPTQKLMQTLQYSAESSLVK